MRVYLHTEEIERLKSRGEASIRISGLNFIQMQYRGNDMATITDPGPSAYERNDTVRIEALKRMSRHA